MRHTLIVISLGWAALLALGACANSQPLGGDPSPGNAVVRVTMDEMNLKPSIASVPAGKVTFVAVNQGKVDHEVVILKTNLAPNALIMLTGISKVDEVASGENFGEVEVEAGVTEAGTFDLTPGHYVLVCNVPGHYKAGMFAAFEVKATTANPTRRHASASDGPE